MVALELQADLSVWQVIQSKVLIYRHIPFWLLLKIWCPGQNIRVFCASTNALQYIMHKEADNISAQDNSYWTAPMDEMHKEGQGFSACHPCL